MLKTFLTLNKGDNLSIFSRWADKIVYFCQGNFFPFFFLFFFFSTIIHPKQDYIDQLTAKGYDDMAMRLDKWIESMIGE